MKLNRECVCAILRCVEDNATPTKAVIFYDTTHLSAVCKALGCAIPTIEPYQEKLISAYGDNDTSYCLRYCIQSELVRWVKHGPGFAILDITDKGRDYMNHGGNATSGNTSFNFAGANISNAVIGNEVSGNQFTFQVGASLAELEARIASKPDADRAVLEEMLAILKGLQNDDKPIKRGIFRRFFDVLNQYSDLVVPLGTAVIGLLG